ncbi:hypothetical protein FB107DRAFT_265257 [Schizophyllum commune]
MFCAAFAGGRAPWLAAGWLLAVGAGVTRLLTGEKGSGSSCWALRGPWAWRGRADRVLNTVKQRIPRERLRALACTCPC